MSRQPLLVILFTVAALTMIDFFLGGDLSFRVLGWLPGVSERRSGTLVLAVFLTALHAVVWCQRMRENRPQWLVQLWTWRVEGLFALIVAFALWSRLRTLAWDTAHGPDGYEAHFVRAVTRMLKEGDLNHTYHEYPGFFLYLLLAAYLVAFVAAVGARMGTTLENIPAAHFLQVGRGLVASFGVLNVVTTFCLGRKWFNPRVGLFASALVAISYLEMYTSQYIRPDVVLEAFLTGALILNLAHLERGTLRSAMVAGAAVGAATAVKYTGFLAIPSLLLAVILAPSALATRWLRASLALGTMIVTYGVLSPYTFLDLPGFLHGVAEQGLYNTDPSLQPAENMSRYYTIVLAHESIGYPALLLMFLGGALVLASPRTMDLVVIGFIVPYLLFFFFSAPAQFDRFLLPVQPVLAALAGQGLDRLRGLATLLPRSVATAAAAGLVALVLAPPLLQSSRYLATRLQPSVRDEVRDWAVKQLPPGSRIGVSRLGPSFHATPFSEGRFERIDASSFPILVHFDFLVSAAIDDRDTLTRFREVVRFEPRRPGGGHTQVVYHVPDELKPRYQQIPLEPTALETTFNPGEVRNLVDGDHRTSWQAGFSDQPVRIDIDLRGNRSVGSIILTVPSDAVDAASRLRVQGSSDERNYFNARRFVLHESTPGVHGWTRVSIILEERPTRFLRLFEPRIGFGGLALSEIELYERERVSKAPNKVR